MAKKKEAPKKAAKEEKSTPGLAAGKTVKEVIDLGHGWVRIIFTDGTAIVAHIVPLAMSVTPSKDKPAPAADDDDEDDDDEDEEDDDDDEEDDDDEDEEDEEDDEDDDEDEEDDEDDDEEEPKKKAPAKKKKK